MRAIGLLLILTAALAGYTTAGLAAAFSRALSLGVVVAILDALIGAQQALAAEAITDPLTGAFNRRHLEVCLAASVVRRARKIDALFRVGGEEFVLLLAGAGRAAAFAVADDLRARIAAARLVDGVAVSISIGVGELRPAQSAAAWLADADAALYRAKQAGRNRVAALGAPVDDRPHASRAYGPIVNREALM